MCRATKKKKTVNKRALFLPPSDTKNAGMTENGETGK